MLLKNLPYKSYAKNIRNKMLSEKLRRKTIARNKRTEMLLKNLPYKSYAKNIRSKMLPENYEEKLSPKISVSKCCSKLILIVAIHRKVLPKKFQPLHFNFRPLPVYEPQDLNTRSCAVLITPRGLPLLPLLRL